MLRSSTPVWKGCRMAMLISVKEECPKCYSWGNWDNPGLRLTASLSTKKKKKKKKSISITHSETNVFNSCFVCSDKVEPELSTIPWNPEMLAFVWLWVSIVVCWFVGFFLQEMLRSSTPVWTGCRMAMLINVKEESRTPPNCQPHLLHRVKQMFSQLPNKIVSTTALVVHVWKLYKQI